MHPRWSLMVLKWQMVLTVSGENSLSRQHFNVSSPPICLTASMSLWSQGAFVTEHSLGYLYRRGIGGQLPLRLLDRFIDLIFSALKIKHRGVSPLLNSVSFCWLWFRTVCVKSCHSQRSVSKLQFKTQICGLRLISALEAMCWLNTLYDFCKEYCVPVNQAFYYK